MNTPQEVARKLLSRPPYKRRQPPQPFKGAIHSLGKGISKPFGWVANHVHGVVLRVACYALLILLALYLIYVLVRFLWERFGGTRRLADQSVPLFVRGISLKEAQKHTDQAERSGQWAEAVRWNYIVGVLQLAQSDRIVFRASQTNSNLRDQLRDNTFDELTWQFESVHYGNHHVDGDGLHQAKRQWHEVLTLSSGTQTHAV